MPFLVLELVEGVDLADRLKRGAVPVDEAIDIWRQIAEAMAAAHECGIIHRDLKPGNVLVTGQTGDCDVAPHLLPARPVRRQAHRG